MSNDTKQTGLSKRVLAILNDFENQGHDVESLLNKAISHLHSEIVLGAIFDTDKNKNIIKIREQSLDKERLEILHRRLVTMENIKTAWLSNHA